MRQESSASSWAAGGGRLTGAGDDGGESGSLSHSSNGSDKAGEGSSQGKKDVGMKRADVGLPSEIGDI